MGQTCAVSKAAGSTQGALRLLDEVVAGHSNAEDRPQQHEMVRLVAQAATTGEPLIVQAGTGTGKSLAYLCAAVGAKASVVVSTATRQLSDQLVNSDVPLVADAVKTLESRTLAAVSLKGRANYLCLAKVDELHRLEARANEKAPPEEQVEELDLGIEVPAPTVVQEPKPSRPTSGDLRALNELLEWAESGPKTGDRVEAPAVADRVWSQVSTDTAGCPGARVCAFGEDCFAERARARARAADVVVVNHALLAQDLISPNPLFDDRDLIVIDEVHELQDYLSSAWGAEIHAGSIDRIMTNAARRVPKSRQSIVDKAFAAVGDAAIVTQELIGLPAQRWQAELPAALAGPLESLERRASELAKAFDEIVKESGADGAANGAALQSARGQLQELANALNLVRTPNDAFVRWSSMDRDGGASILRAAPLTVGRMFRDRVGTRALVATSATACVAGDFTPLADAMGLVNPSAQAMDGEPLPQTWAGVDVGSPFDYQKQAILYIPDDIPEPVGKDRAEHTAAVLDELTELVGAAGGRTLALFTTTAAARNAADHLRQKTKHVVLEHGELPPAVLAQEFAEDETSVLCATMGMWAGLNVVGPACTLVVIDKIPFAPMDDPLSAARRANIDAAGGNGFKEVFVNHAALMLTQGAGRLVRHREDRGVVAILDPRIHTRGYGRLIVSTLPPMWRTTDRDLVLAALRRLAEPAKV